MKKSYVLITALILFLSISTVSAGLFGFGTIECDQFSIDIPSGFSITEGWESYPELHVNHIWLGTGIPTGDETHRWFDMSENKVYNDDLVHNKVVVENYTEDNLLIEKCHSENGADNFTYAEFDKEGHHYVITISWKNDLEKLNLADDVELIKKVIDSTKHK